MIKTHCKLKDKLSYRMKQSHPTKVIDTLVFISLKTLILIIFMCICMLVCMCACMSVCIPSLFSTHRGQKGVSGTLGPQVVLSCCARVPGTEPGSSEMAASALTTGPFSSSELSLNGLICKEVCSMFCIVMFTDKRS